MNGLIHRLATIRQIEQASPASRQQFAPRFGETYSVSSYGDRFAWRKTGFYMQDLSAGSGPQDDAIDALRSA
jgi:hypothetical protein